ncbi:hypothetical protein [Methylomagnum sp.]
MDYHHLLKEGIRLCQQLAGDHWTDYNEHDPGVTILEQLCYALTDLAYRTGYRVEDILAETGALRHRPGQDVLYPGDQILTCNPLTIDDYRNLIYDQVDNVDNVWLKPVESHPLGIHGLYNIFVEAPDLGLDRRNLEEQVRRDIQGLMSAHRNLAEDVESIRLLKSFGITVRVAVVIGDDANPIDVLAKIMISLQESFAPDPKLTPVDVSLGANIPPDEVFVGPRLDYGIARDGDLKDLPREIAVGQVRNTILAVPGVKYVKDLDIDEARNGIVRLPPDTVPHLHPSISRPLPPGEAYRIEVRPEGGQPVEIDARRLWKKLKAYFDERKDATAYDFLKLEHSAYLKPTEGTPQNIGHYYSIQHQFPMVYGIGRYGIPESRRAELPGGEAGDAASQRRRRLAEARQLKAYLLFFEQLLANYLAQLAHAADLFSLDPTLDRTYFSLPLAHVPPRGSDPPDAIEVLRRSRNITPGPGRFSICIIDERPSVGEGGHSMEILLRSRKMASNEQEFLRLSDAIIAAGKDPDNYQWDSASDGDIRLVLLDPGKHVLAIGAAHFVSVERVRGEVRYLTGFMSRLERDAGLRRRYVAKVHPKQSIGVRVVDDRARVLLSCSDLPDEAAREARVRQILKNGLRESNYAVVQHSSGELSVVLRDFATAEIIARGEKRLGAETQAHEEIRELVDRLKRLRANAPVPDTFIQRLPDHPQNAARQVVDDYARNLERLIRDPDALFLRRRERFLDHLLARFNEEFDDLSLSRLDPRPYHKKADFYRESIRWKTDFLGRYPALSGGRGRGLDYWRAGDEAADDGPAAGQSQRPGQPGWERRSGLEQRLYFLLGLQGHIDANGGYAPTVRPVATDGAPASEDCREDEDGGADPFVGECLYVVEHILLRPHTPAKVGFWGHDIFNGKSLCLESRDRDQVSANRRLEAVLKEGVSPGNYRILPDPEGPGYRLALTADRGRGEVIARGRACADEDAAEQEKLAVSAHIARLAESSELRRKSLKPHQRKDDFYSFRLSVMLPSWPTRFREPGFQQFAENTVRENCPAHLACRCLWLNRALLEDFETVYGEWERLKTEPGGNPSETDDAAEALRAFIEWLEAPATEREAGIPDKVRDIKKKVARRKPPFRAVPSR